MINEQEKTMRALKYTCKNGRSSTILTKVPKPMIETPSDVLIRVEAVSICGTDSRALANPPVFEFVEGVTIGHECCGIVEEIGENVTNCKVDEKVVVHPNIWCGKCVPCREGRINLCENFRHIGDRIDGAMAEYLCIDERMVYKIDQNVPSYVASLAEPLACVLNGTTTIPAKPGDNVIVLGGGPIGLIFSMLYKNSGARVLVSEPSEYRRKLAMDLGVDYAINPNEENYEEALRNFVPRGADIVVDAVGVLLPLAIRVAGKAANIVVFGVNQTDSVQISQYPITEKELTIRGTYITKGTFPLSVKIIEEKIIPIEKLITHRIGMEGLMHGITLMNEGVTGKVVMEI